MKWVQLQIPLITPLLAGIATFRQHEGKQARITRTDKSEGEIEYHQSSFEFATYEIAFEAARVSLAALSKEASEAMDLVVPDIVDGLVYGSRSLSVCGFLGAYLLSERTLDTFDPSITERIRTVLSREIKYVRLAGESDVPLFLLLASALEQLGDIKAAEAAMLSLVRTISKLNQRHSPAALADPYHDTEQVLLHSFGADMLSSKYGVSPASLLSLRPAFRWVSCDILRYS